MSLPDDLVEKIISALESRKAILPCPRCGCEDFHLIDGFTVHIMQSNIADFKLYGRGIICIGVICDNCGYFAEHSLKELSLMEEAEKYADTTN